MSRIAVLGGTGYAGSAIVAEATARGHQVTALSRTLPPSPVATVDYVQGEATDEAALATVIRGTDVVVGALAPRGPLTDRYRDVYRTVARLADVAGAAFYVVGGFSSLRPALDADRFVTDLSNLPAELHDEVLAGAAVVMKDLPATPASLDWVYVSPALQFGAHVPGESRGSYQLGDEVAVRPDHDGPLSAADYALGFLDLVEKGEYHRAQVNIS